MLELIISRRRRGRRRGWRKKLKRRKVQSACSQFMHMDTYKHICIYVWINLVVLMVKRHHGGERKSIAF
jgi:hypothetical protein